MANVCVVGAGVVGRATGAGFIKHDHSVRFVDIDESLVAELNAEGLSAFTPGNLELGDCDAIFVSVSAPTRPEGVDLTNVLRATELVGEKLKTVTSSFPVVVFRCTQPPGTTRELLIPALESRSGLSAGSDFGVVYWPEYLRAISAEHDFLNPRLAVLSSLDQHDRSHELIAALALDFATGVHWLSFEAAEFQKYVSNVTNAIKISAFNWFRDLAEKTGLDRKTTQRVFELTELSAEAMWNPLYGTRDLGPYEGECLPKDVAALRIYADELGAPTALLDAVIDVNDYATQRLHRG